MDAATSVSQQGKRVGTQWSFEMSPYKVGDVDLSPSIFFVLAQTADVVAAVGKSVTMEWL